MQTTIEFMQDSARLAGFGNGYNKMIEDGIKAGQPTIELPHASKNYPDGSVMLWQPKLTEQEKNPGRYNFGYTATLAHGDKEPVQQYFPSFKKTGATLEQSKMLLQGATVLVTDWDNKKNAKRTVFAKLDLSTHPKPGENHSVQRINGADLDIGILYSKEKIVSKQDEKDRHLRELQQGQKIDVTIKDNSTGQPLFIPASLQFNLINEGNVPKLAMNVIDADGVILRSPSIEPNQSVTQTKGLVVGQQENANLPESLLKVLGIQKADEEGAKEKQKQTGGKKRSAA